MTTASVTSVNWVRLTTASGQSLTLESTDDIAVRLLVQRYQMDYPTTSIAAAPLALSIDLVTPGRLGKGRERIDDALIMATKVHELTSSLEQFRVEAEGHGADGKTLTCTVDRAVLTLDGVDRLPQWVEQKSIRCLDAMMLRAVTGEQYRIEMTA